MKQVYVLGDGQLGRMLYQAGELIGINVCLVGLYTKPESVMLSHNSIITAEIERWPETHLTNRLSNHNNFVNKDIFPKITDRLNQKQLLDKLNIATAHWKLLNNKSEWPIIFNELGESVIVKQRIGVYNGHGQWSVHATETDLFPDNFYGKCIVEQNINFNYEVSLIAARERNGNIVFYPLTYNLHNNGLLLVSIVFPQDKTKQQIKIESMLYNIMHELNYIGVMAMECFITSSGCLLVNELSPRVHNSGHWTQNGASISQFELHLRAIHNLPLPKPIVEASSVMINLIGTELNYSWLKLPLVNLHWYNKDVRPGRKVGHINITSTNIECIYTTLELLAELLPIEYNNSIMWAKSQLNSM